MHKVVFIVLFCILALTSSSGQDLVVNSEDLTFHTDLEKKIFSEILNDRKTDEFDLFMASGSLLTDSKVKEARIRFYSQLEEYKAEKIASRKNDKKVKYIYESIHKVFLKKFETNASFEEIFYNGSYNAVSGTALFALVFNELKIPYAIKEEAETVFLLAYPEGERIRIETTSPNGVMAMNAAFKQQYIKTLKEHKLISLQEGNTKSTDELFDKYYFGNQQSISLINLAGIQYMNSAILLNDQKKFSEAMINLEKGYVLFPSQRSAYLLMLSTASALDARKQRDSTHAHLLARIASFREFGMTNEVIQGEFARSINHLLFERGRKDEASRYFNVLTKKITNNILVNDLSYIYHYETGRLIYNQGKYKEALSFFEKALQVKPDSPEIGNTFISTLAQTFSSGGSNLDHIGILENYAAKYPSLKENNNFNIMLAASYLVQTGLEFDMEKPVPGEKYRLQFEAFMKSNPDLPINSQLLGHAYSRSAIFYFRKGQTAKAKEIIETGLRHSPNNYELLSRKQMIR